MDQKRGAGAPPAGAADAAGGGAAEEESLRAAPAGSGEEAQGLVVFVFLLFLNTSF